MKEIRCKNCNHTLAKDVEVGCGFFYLTPDRDLVLYREVTKCPSCKMLNEIKVKVGVNVTIKIVNDPTAFTEIRLNGKTNLNSA